MGRLPESARRTLNRNWQNGRLWWNDPEAFTLSGHMPETEYRFHAAAVMASGGWCFRYHLNTLPPARVEMLNKLLPPTGMNAEFEDADLRVGLVHIKDGMKDRLLVCLFNWCDAPHKLSFQLPAREM